MPKKKQYTDARASEKLAVAIDTPRGKIKSLDDLFGDKYSKYQTHDFNEYKLSLAEMNLTDLQREATRVLLAPNPNRALLTERLLKQFERTQMALNAHTIKETVVKVGKEGRAVLNEGANKFS